jgi:hypothetical protein
MKYNPSVSLRLRFASVEDRALPARTIDNSPYTGEPPTVNPQAIGSDAKALRGRLQPSSRSKRDRLRKGGAARQVRGSCVAKQ